MRGRFTCPACFATVPLTVVSKTLTAGLAVLYCQGRLPMKRGPKKELSQEDETPQPRTAS